MCPVHSFSELPSLRVSWTVASHLSLHTCRSALEATGTRSFPSELSTLRLSGWDLVLVGGAVGTSTTSHTRSSSRPGAFPEGSIVFAGAQLCCLGLRGLPFD